MKPRQNLKVSAINYEPQGVPLKASGRVNAQTSRFYELELKSDLSNYHEILGQKYSFVFMQRPGSAISMHMIVRAELTLSTSGFNNDSLIYLKFALVV